MTSPTQLMKQIVVRALELILCRLRAMLQGYLFKYLACLQEPSKTHLNQIMCISIHSIVMGLGRLLEACEVHEKVGA